MTVIVCEILKLQFYLYKLQNQVKLNYVFFSGCAYARKTLLSQKSGVAVRRKRRALSPVGTCGGLQLADSAALPVLGGGSECSLDGESFNSTWSNIETILILM